MNVINTEKAPGAIGPYSQAFEVNGCIYTLGPDSGKSRRRQCTGRDCGTGRAELQECGRHFRGGGQRI